MGRRWWRPTPDLTTRSLSQRLVGRCASRNRSEPSPNLAPVRFRATRVSLPGFMAEAFSHANAPRRKAGRERRTIAALVRLSDVTHVHVANARHPQARA